ncbi:uncharacterized protein LOC142776801 [Rhipicephalus microplus]|uniref:uncharacterized protein LOC142776801 n=1 Tax=Rhipicephalus microplus TaxID=6941 RepID=UPI003F6AE4F0
MTSKDARMRPRIAAGSSDSGLGTVGRPAVVSVRGAADGQVPYANGQVPYANKEVPHANGQATYANGAPGQASAGVAAAVPPCSAKLQPDTIAAATLTMNGVSHGIVVGATANGPRCMAPTEEESIPASSPLYQDPGVVHPNGICGPRQRSSDDLHLQNFFQNFCVQSFHLEPFFFLLQRFCVICFCFIWTSVFCFVYVL